MPTNCQLFTFKLSGNCYKVRLFLDLLNLEYTAVEVDLTGGEHKHAPILALNPLGQVPVLVDGEAVISDSQAILVYLARRYGDETWLPADPLPMAQVARWLSIAANEIQHGPASARLIELFGAKLDRELTLNRSATILSHMDSHLTQQHWLVNDRPTIADIACYPYISLASDGNIDIKHYPHLCKWLSRVEDLPGFTPMHELAESA